MHYKCVVFLAFALAFARVIKYAPRVVLQIVASLTDDTRGVIYSHKMFICPDCDEEKSFITLEPGVCIIKLFKVIIIFVPQ